MVQLVRRDDQAPLPTPTADRVRRQAGRGPCTLLGIGVVSRTTVDAAVELANTHEVDLMLVASRRQVDMDSLGGGYVCGWNAERFAAYVGERDSAGRIMLCRDHGGPWQNSREIAEDLAPEAAMESAKRSYVEDIEAGFGVLHLDTSVTPEGAPCQQDALARLKELYLFCAAASETRGRPVAFEIGTEEQDGVSHEATDVLDMLEGINLFCDRHALQRPLFVVAQTGTKVMEMRNVGVLESRNGAGGAPLAQLALQRLIASLDGSGVLLKQHNTDYLSDASLRRHPVMGVHAANVAPEFGVVESRALVQGLEAHGLVVHRDRFLELAFASRKWEKWMLPDTSATDRDRAVIAGHYVFSTPAFAELKAAMSRDLAARGVDLQACLLSAVKASILRYMTIFGLLGARQAEAL